MALGGDGDNGAEPKRARSLLAGWQFWLGLAVSVFFLYWAFQQASDLGRVGQALGAANYWFMVPALVAYFAGVAVRALRWKVLLRPVKPLGARKLFPIIVIGYMANDVLPARMGEFVRVYVLGRSEGVSKTAGIATIFVERVFDGLTMLLFIAAVAVFVPLGSGIDTIVRIAGAVFVGAFLVALVVASSPTRFARLVGLLARFVPSVGRERLIAFADRFIAGLAVLQDARALGGILVLSLVAWLFEAATYYLLSFGFGLGLAFPAYVLTTAVANLGTMVPSSPGYVGTFEALSVFSLGLFAVAADQALSYAVALHVLLLVPVTLLGFYYMWRRHLRLRRFD